MLDRLADTREIPDGIVLGNASEFVGHAVYRWAYERSVTLHFVHTGKPVKDALEAYEEVKTDLSSGKD